MAALKIERVHKGSQKKTGRNPNTDSTETPRGPSRRGEAGTSRPHPLVAPSASGLQDPGSAFGASLLSTQLIDLTVWGESLLQGDAIAGCGFNYGRDESWITIGNLKSASSSSIKHIIHIKKIRLVGMKVKTWVLHYYLLPN